MSAALLLLFATLGQSPDAGVAGAEGVSAEELAELEALVKAEADAGTPGTAAASSPSPVQRALQTLNPDLSVILDVALAGFSEDEPLQTGAHDPRNQGFNLQQLELSIRSAVDPYFRFDSNIVFSQFGVEIEEAYATTSALPYRLQLRGGQFLTRFGRQNPTHPHTWQFVDQPFAIGRVFGGEGNRGLGVELSWLAPTSQYLELIGSATEAGGGATARSFLGGSGLPVRSPADVQYTAALKHFLDVSDDVSLLSGLSAATGPNDTGHRNFTNVFGADLYLKYRPLSGGDPTVLSLQAEVFYRRRQVPSDVLADTSLYAEVLWRFLPRVATAVRYEYGSPAVGLDGKVAADALDPEWEAGRQRVALAFTFWPTEFSRIRAQGSMDAPGWEERPRFAAFLALEVVVGAHGAHSF